MIHRITEILVTHMAANKIGQEQDWPRQLIFHFETAADNGPHTNTSNTVQTCPLNPISMTKVQMQETTELQPIALQPGVVIGGYEISRQIGEGAIAEIYLARQLKLGRDVALKVLKYQHDWGEETIKLFEGEARTIAQLNHPNIVQVIDCGRHDQLYYFVMEYVDGTDFKHIMSKSLYSIPQKLEIIIQALKALDFAHNNGVIHRDFKPANILVSSTGYVRVADFGIALVQDNRMSDQPMAEQAVVGTPAYMSPEQWKVQGTIDHRSDIYSAGVILYEALTSKKPPENLTPPSALCSEVSPRFDAIVLKCLQRNPEDRYQTAVQLKNELLTALKDIAAQRETKGEATQKIGVGFVGKYIFLDTLQESQFGATYLVKNTENDSLCIIKKLCKNLGGVREARILSKLAHPNLIKIYGVGSDSDKGILITEYAEGGSLGDRLIKPYPLNTATRIFRQIASGLAYAHRNGVIHGNVRPTNILFDKANNVKLTDFALPEHYLRNRDNWYSAPERKRSRAADIYAAGIILHQLLTSRLPDIRARGELGWISKSSDLRFVMLNLVSQMLEIDPSRRPGSFDAILSSMENQQQSDTGSLIPLAEETTFV